MAIERQFQNWKWAMAILITHIRHLNVFCDPNCIHKPAMEAGRYDVSVCVYMWCAAHIVISSLLKKLFYLLLYNQN